MDYILNIIIERIDLEKIGLKEKKYEWGGEVFSCNPVQYSSDSNIIFEEIENYQSYISLDNMEMFQNAIALCLKSDILYDFEYTINNNSNELIHNSLFCFLKELSKLKSALVLLFREDEEIKEYHEIKSDEDFYLVITNSLKWDNPKDILLYVKR